MIARPGSWSSRRVRPGRARTLIVGGGVALVLSGCGTFSDNTDAATVEDTSVSQEDYEDVLDVLTANSELTSVVEDPATDTIASDQGRTWLTVMIRDVAAQAFLEDAGEPITDADRQQVLDTVADDDPARDLPANLLDLLVNRQAGTAARARIAAPSAAELEQRYTELPASIGLVCVRHILVATEAEAHDVLDELDGGADFAELAAARSIDDTTADSAGEVASGNGQACMAVPEAQQTLDPDFFEGVVAARPGALGSPVASSSGWHVIEARPYEDVADSIAALYEVSAGELLFAGYLATADVKVDPRYGRWSTPTGSVVAL